MKRKFKYLVYTYLNFGIRCQAVYYLVNGKHGLKKIDEEHLTELNVFGKQIQLVFTKVDEFKDPELLTNLNKAYQFGKTLKNCRFEILMTSTEINFGIDDLRVHLFADLFGKERKGEFSMNTYKE